MQAIIGVYSKSIVQGTYVLKALFVCVPFVFPVYSWTIASDSEAGKAIEHQAWRTFTTDFTSSYVIKMFVHAAHTEPSGYIRADSNITHRRLPK